VVLETEKIRKSGLDENMAAETNITDSYGNRTTEITLSDSGSKREILRTDYPDSVLDAETVFENGLAIQSESKTGRKWTYGYDGLGRISRIHDSIAGQTVIHYDAKGRIDCIDEAGRNFTCFSHDPETGRPAVKTDALGHSVRFAYNERGQVTHIWGDGATPQKFVYDALGRLVEIHTFRGGSDWNSVGVAEGFAGPADVTRRLYHEATGLLTAIEYPDGSRVSYTYTAGSRLESRSWSRRENSHPVTTTYTYDSATGELTGVSYSDGTPEARFSYDRLGRVTHVTDALGERTFTYDPATLTLASEQVAGVYERTIARSYAQSGVLGRASGVSLGAGYRTAWSYDDYGRVHVIGFQAAGVQGAFDYGYLPGSDLIREISGPGAFNRLITYDETRGLLAGVENRFDGALISGYDYSRDVMGRIGSVSKSGLAVKQAYRDRLQTASWLKDAPSSQAGVEIVPDHREYRYDSAGNRKSTVDWDDSSQTLRHSRYLAGCLNQYERIDREDEEGVRTETFGYDADANLASRQNGTGVQLVYDAENRLSAVFPSDPADGDTRVEFLYDYMGRRILKAWFSFETGRWQWQGERQYVYDGFNVIEEISVENGDAPDSTFYVRGLDLSGSFEAAGGIGGLLAAVDASDDAVYYYNYAANGDVVQLVDRHGAISAHYDYDPFGRIVYRSGTRAQTNAYRFSTKYFDDETGLGYWGYRYYSPDLGRWITRDPVEEPGSKLLRAENGKYLIGLQNRFKHYPYTKSVRLLLNDKSTFLSSINLFLFVDANPINIIDPFGLWGEDVHSGIGNSEYGTFIWAKQVGFSDESAAIIARSNDAVDGGWGSWMPIIGNQSRHFNQSDPNYPDTRILWAEIEFKKALEAQRLCDAEKALAHLGRGLHSLQDVFAHRDWDTGFCGWRRHPDWYDSWDDFRNGKARELTAQATKDYLHKFTNIAYKRYIH
jgi:RHS repeat-associated protein